jgi:nickel-type superoxide dismutase maturation protease
MIAIRRVSGISMIPTLKPGGIVLALRVKKYKIGDIVIFAHDSLDKIKRISSINGYDYQVIGDNPEHSTDSREFGRINQSEILGKVIWPINKNKEKYENLSNT